jgi:hypothetical protein
MKERPYQRAVEVQSKKRVRARVVSGFHAAGFTIQVRLFKAQVKWVFKASGSTVTSTVSETVYQVEFCAHLFGASCPAEFPACGHF